MWGKWKSIISLTFDDGLPCQLKNAIPAMGNRLIPGTFFLPTNAAEYPIDWAAWKDVLFKAQLRGICLELGSHSHTHTKAKLLAWKDAFYEAKHSSYRMEHHLGVRPISFCYPYTDAPAHVQDAAKKYYKQARGGRVAGNQFITPGSCNIYNVPAYHVNGNCIENGEIYPVIQEAIERRAWLVLMFHGVGQEGTWDNVPYDAFVSLLDRILLYKEDGLGVVTFAEGADLYRGNL